MQAAPHGGARDSRALAHLGNRHAASGCRKRQHHGQAACERGDEIGVIAVVGDGIRHQIGRWRGIRGINRRQAQGRFGPGQSSRHCLSLHEMTSSSGQACRRRVCSLSRIASRRATGRQKPALHVYTVGRYAHNCSHSARGVQSRLVSSRGYRGEPAARSVSHARETGACGTTRARQRKIGTRARSQDHLAIGSNHGPA